MVRRHLAAAAALAVVLFVMLAPAALADPLPHRYYNNGNHGQGWGRDPCDKPKHVPDYCQQAPEAPAGLLYPAAAGAALTLFACCERRRRRHQLSRG